MEPDGHGEELPEPTGVTINLNPDRVIAALQRRAATLIQNLQWELATRDAVVEVLEERLRESEQLREEAEGALAGAADNFVSRVHAEQDAFLMADKATADEGLEIDRS